MNGVDHHNFAMESPLLDCGRISGKQARSAALWLAGHATDAVELRNWLEACGLLSYKPGTSRKYTWGEQHDIREGVLA